MPRLVTSQEAARRLGVKLPTLYAYVSRGLLDSRPAADRRGSLFDLDDVERLARRSRHDRPAASRPVTVATAVTALGPDGPRYRGRAAVDLAGTTPFEEVAALLWQDPDSAGGRWAGRALPPWPPGPGVGTAADALRLAVVWCGVGDPLRADLRPAAVVRNARGLIGTAVDALPRLPDGGMLAGGGLPAGGAPVADRLAARLVPRPSPALVRAVDAALVLLADHELATSTVAVRVAASTRADVYDAVLAGLATLAGPLHGGASQLAVDLLHQADRLGAEAALDAALRWQGGLPGFGHPVYQDGDARFAALLPFVEAVGSAGDTALVHQVLDLARAHDLPPPNVDLGLAALVLAGGLPADAGRTLFAVARMAGWTAHYLEELEEPPLRWRARAVYAGTVGATPDSPDSPH